MADMTQIVIFPTSRNLKLKLFHIDNLEPFRSLAVSLHDKPGMTCSDVCLHDKPGMTCSDVCLYDKPGMTCSDVCLLTSRCRHKQTGKEYAVKIVSRRMDCSREIHLLRLCQGHPNIVQLHDVFQDEVSVVTGGSALRPTCVVCRD